MMKLLGGFLMLLVLLVPAGMVAALIYLIRSVIKNNEQTRVLWDRLGENLGLQVIQNKDPWWRRRSYLSELLGRIEGIEVVCKQIIRGSGKSQTAYLTVSVRCETDWELQISPEHIFAKMGKALFGMQDIITGDTALDQRFIIKSSHERSAKEILSDRETRHQLLRLMPTNNGALYLKNNYLCYEQVGNVLKPDDLELWKERVLAMVDWSRVWSRVRGNADR